MTDDFDSAIAIFDTLSLSSFTLARCVLYGDIQLEAQQSDLLDAVSDSCRHPKSTELLTNSQRNSQYT